MVNKLMSFPVRYRPEVPDGHVMIAGFRPSGPGTLDPIEEYGTVLRPDGSIVSYVIRDGKASIT